MSSYKKNIKMFYESLKKFVKKIPAVWVFLKWLKDQLIVLSRLKDVFIMMILFHLWPEQVYRFSTRKLLPCKKNRYFKKSNNILPFEVLELKTSNIQKMKEINIVGRGSSFDLNSLNNLKGPIFLISFWSTLKIDKKGAIVYAYHPGYRPRSIKKDYSGLKELKNNNFTYWTGGLDVEHTKDIINNGHNVICCELYIRDKNHNLYSIRKNCEFPHYLDLLKNDLFKNISMEEKVYITPSPTSYPYWAPTGSLLPAIYALLPFAEKINVFGWDFYLETSPENMNYWEFFFNMYKFKFDINESRNHFESALINFYFALQLSKQPNINIHGHLGKLEKHTKIINKIERVLYN